MVGNNQNTWTLGVLVLSPKNNPCISLSGNKDYKQMNPKSGKIIGISVNHANIWDFKININTVVEAKETECLTYFIVQNWDYNISKGGTIIKYHENDSVVQLNQVSGYKVG